MPGIRSIGGPAGSLCTGLLPRRFFVGDDLGEGCPRGVVVGADSGFNVVLTGEEDIHGVAQEAAVNETLAEGSQNFSEGFGETGRLIVLEVIEAGIGSGEADDFVHEEVEIGGEALDEREFGGLRADFHFPFPVSWGEIDGGIEDECDLIEGDPGDLGPEWLVEIEVDLAVAVVAHHEEEAAVEPGMVGLEETTFPEGLVAFPAAEPSTEEGIEAGEFSEFEKFLVDGTSFRFAEGE